MTNAEYDPALADLVSQVKFEILADIQTGMLPVNVSSFSALRHHVDADRYGGQPADMVEAMRKGAMREVVDRWLSTGRGLSFADYLWMERTCRDALRENTIIPECVARRIAWYHAKTPSEWGCGPIIKFATGEPCDLGALINRLSILIGHYSSGRPFRPDPQHKRRTELRALREWAIAAR